MKSAFHKRILLGGLLALGLLVWMGAWVVQANDEWRERHHRMGGERHERMGMPGMGPMQKHFARWLDLDQTQAQKMHKLYAAYKKEMVRRKAEIRIAEMDLADLLEEKNPDPKALERAVKKLESLRADLLQYRIDTLMKTREFLREEQFQRFKNWIANQLREGGAWHHGHHKGHHGGYGRHGKMGHRGGMMGGMMGGKMGGMMGGKGGMMGGMEGSNSSW